MDGVLIPNLTPGSPEWARTMSASKVGAMLGLSPFESPYALWRKMRGEIPWDDGSNADEKRRGHYLEEPLRRWYQDQHMGINVAPGHSYAHPHRSDHVAAPDGLIRSRGLEPRVVALLECKTANNEWEWGADGSDEIPPHYKAQAQWQMYVTGVEVCHLAVLTPYMTFREFTVQRDKDDVAFLVQAADDWMESLQLGRVPNLDDSDHTYQAVRALHPDIVDTPVELPGDVAVEWVHALQAKAAAEKAFAGARTRVADAMGNARVARFADQTYATRQSRGGGTPYVVAARGLIAQEESTAA